MSTRNREHPKHRGHHRSHRKQLPLDLVSDVPHKVSAALDALGEPRLAAFAVRHAVRDYAHVTSMSRERLSGDNNDWLEFSVPIDRGALERAMQALPERHAVHLRRIVTRLDDQLLAKTINDYRADQSSPWWSRRHGL